MLVLPSSLTHREAPDAVRMLTQTIRRETAGGRAGEVLPPLAIDASALAQFDSSALAVLLECSRLAAASGRSLTLKQAPPKLRQLARLYGLDALLGAADTPSAGAVTAAPETGST
jgi:phospholipid transport system transporter-binding protein